MQDDFKVPGSPPANMPETGEQPVPQPAAQTFSPAQPVESVMPSAPSLGSTDAAPQLAPASNPVSQAPAIEAAPAEATAPTSAPQPVPAPLSSLTPTDPGPIPPATSMNFPPAQSFGGPTVSGPVFGGPSGPTSPSVGGAAPSAGVPKKTLLLGGAAAVVVLAAATYVFGFYLPNTPTNVYSSSLKNSGTALDALITYSQQQEHTKYSSTSFTGTLHAKSPGASYDVNLSGAMDKNVDGKMQLSADLMGEKINANIESIKAAGNTSPDIYLQVTGIKSTLDNLGMNKYDYLDGPWVMVDHTLVDTYLSNYQQALGSDPTLAKSGGAPTYAAINNAIAKVQAVNKQYLFTTNSAKAVLANQKFIAKETTSGHTYDHYKVGYSKDHLSAYVTAVGQALDSSQLNTWYKGVSSGKNLSDGMKLSSLQTDIKSADSNYTFDLWADTKTKLVSKVGFADPSNKSSVFSVAQNYTGGTTFPFVLGFTGKDSSGNAQAANLNISLDTKTHKAALAFTSNTTSSDGITNVSGSMSMTPSNDLVQVAAPKSAKSLSDILVALGLSDTSTGNVSGVIANSNQTLPPGYTTLGNTQ